MSLEFGTPVKVYRVAHRLKKGWPGVHTSHRDGIRYEIIQDKAWPGDPLPETEVDPDHDRAVMVRRLDVLAPLKGVVVGKTWREEGYVQAGGHEDPGYLARRGPRVPLYEVALNVEDLGKAQLRLVHELDMEAS